MDELKTLRNEIDQIDRQMVELFRQRMDVTRRVGEYKAAAGIPVLDQVAETLSDAYLVQQELGMNECTVICCERSIRSMAEQACEAAIAYRKNMM